MQTLVAPEATVRTEQNGWPTRGKWRYEDYLRLPDDGKRYEIIEGVLYVANAPSYDHQFADNRISFYFQLLTIEQDLGVVLTAPFEVHLAETISPYSQMFCLSAKKTSLQPAPKFSMEHLI